jgi:hypothetical protein
MTRSCLTVGALAVLLISSSVAFADDPTSVLLQQKGHHRAPRDLGACRSADSS